MGRFIRTLLLGVGIGLLIAPKRGEEMRQLLTDRFQQLGNSFAGNTQQGQSSSQSTSGENTRGSASIETRCGSSGGTFNDVHPANGEL